jgi:DNA-binding NarL/FixJ family response regulator
MSINIVIVEDNAKVAKALSEKVELDERFKVKWIACNGKELLELLKEDHALDIILMDIHMPEMDGIAATEAVKRLYPQLKVVMSTIFDEEEVLLRAIIAGANGYLLKDEKPARIHQAMEDVLNGGAPMSAGIANKALILIRAASPTLEATSGIDYKLTKRQVEILEQLSVGRSYQNIANNLTISPATVRKHIENIYQRLQVHNKVEAVQLARKNRLI